MEYIKKHALISQCGQYRYWLTRQWEEVGEHGRFVSFVGLNPSTADADVDDPTIRRCVGFAKQWGFAGLVMLNLYAFRATKPADMKAADDPAGPGSLGYIMNAFSSKALTDVVLCWGNHAEKKRGDIMIDLAHNYGLRVWHLGLTKSGNPRHPLYLPKDTQRIQVELRGRSAA
ncbi:MAG: DUF1643 domain-containing protein [Pseudomonadota bacterium]